MMSVHKAYSRLKFLWRQYVILLKIIESDVPKCRNSHHPNRKAPWADSINPKHALEEQVVHKYKTTSCSYLRQHPYIALNDYSAFNHKPKCKKSSEGHKTKYSVWNPK